MREKLLLVQKELNEFYGDTTLGGLFVDSLDVCGGISFIKGTDIVYCYEIGFGDNIVIDINKNLMYDIEDYVRNEAEGKLIKMINSIQNTPLLKYFAILKLNLDLQKANILSISKRK